MAPEDSGKKRLVRRLISWSLVTALVTLWLPVRADAAFVTPTRIAANGSFSGWGEPGEPAAGVYLVRDATNSGNDDGSGFAGTEADLNYFWTAMSTQNGGSPAGGSNPIQNVYYRIDTLSTSTMAGGHAGKFNIQMNLGAANPGYVDHLLEISVDTTVTIIMFQYQTPYPAIRVFTSGAITGKVSNVASPYAVFADNGGVQDATATGAQGLYDGSHYGVEVKIPVSWFSSTYGGSVKNDGTGAAAMVGAVFSSSGNSLNSVGTPKDAVNDSSGLTLMYTTSAVTGETTFPSKAITRLSFTTAAQSITAGVASSVMTVETEDATGAPETVASNTTVTLTSTSGTSYFATSAGGPWTGTPLNITIASGTSSTTFYYKDTTAGAPTVTAASTGLTSGAQQETVTAGPIAKLGFTSLAQTVTAGVASAVITIQSQDQYGNAKAVTSDTPITLASANGTGVFASSATGPWTLNSVTILNTQSSAIFYYTDTIAGAVNITASKTGWTSATQQETIAANILARIWFTTAAQTIAAGAPSAFITVQSQDIYGNPKTVAGNTTVTLTSSSVAASFATSAAGPWTATTLNITIAAGSNSANFYYKDANAGAPIVTAASSGLASGTQSETVVSMVSISNPLALYAFGAVAVNATRNSGLTYFTVTNSGSAAVNITISGTDMTGGTAWTLSDTATPGANTVGLKAGLEGGSYATVIRKNPVYNMLVSSLGAGNTQRWGLQLLAPTSFSDGNAKSGTITLTATQAS